MRRAREERLSHGRIREEERKLRECGVSEARGVEDLSMTNTIKKQNKKKTVKCPSIYQY